MTDLKDIDYQLLPDEQIRHLIVGQLLLEWDGGQGVITPETAREVQHFAIRNLGVGGMDGGGWKAAEEALRIASLQQEEGKKIELPQR